MTFIALAINYGFQPDFALRWLKAAALSYVTVMPVVFFVVPLVQHLVFRLAGLDLVTPAADTLTAVQKRKPRREPGPNCSRLLRVAPRMVLVSS